MAMAEQLTLQLIMSSVRVTPLCFYLCIHDSVVVVRSLSQSKSL